MNETCGGGVGQDDPDPVFGVIKVCRCKTIYTANAVATSWWWCNKSVTSWLKSLREEEVRSDV